MRNVTPIIMRPLCHTDKDDYVRWRRDPMIAGVMRGGCPNDEELNAEIEMRFHGKRSDEIYLAFDVNGKHAGDARIRKLRDRK